MRLKIKLQIQIAETVEEALPDNPAFKQALADCVMNAKKNLGWSYPLLGPYMDTSLSLKKGFQYWQRLA